MMRQNNDLQSAIRVGNEAGDIALDIQRNLGDQNARAISSQTKVPFRA